MRVQDSHQGSEDQGLSEESESCDGDEEKVGEDDEEMSDCVLSHRPHQIEEDQVLENILFGKIFSIRLYLENEERIFQVVHQRIRVQDKEPGVETVAIIFRQ